MPPLDLWLKGSDQPVTRMAGPGHECAGSKLVPTSVNGTPAFAQHRVDPAGGRAPWSMQVVEVLEVVEVVEVVDHRITGMTAFLDTPTLFPSFGLPAHLDE